MTTSMRIAAAALVAALPLLWPMAARAQLPMSFANAVNKGPSIQNVGADHAVLFVHTQRAALILDWGPTSAYGTQVSLNRNSGMTNDFRVVTRDIDLLFGFGGTAEAYIYEINLTDLTPDTEYHYEVTLPAGGGFGEEKSGDLTFFTAPPRGGRFVFVAAGDNKAEPQDALGFNQHHTKIAALWQADPDIRMMIDTGDIVDDSNPDTNWATVYTLRRDFLTKVPWFPSVGNHDFDNPDNGRAFQIYVNVPRTPLPMGHGLPTNDIGGLEDTELFYSYDFGGVRFLTYHGTGDMSMGSEQHQFFIDELAAHRCNGPIVVYGHQPWFSSALDAGIDLQREALYQPLFASEGVDLVVFGHRHFYERMDPTHPQMLGIQHIVTGGLGATLDDFIAPARPYSVFRRKTYNYVRIEVDGWDMHAEVYDEDGNMFDQWSLLRTYENDPAACQFVPPMPDGNGPAGGDGSGTTTGGDTFRNQGLKSIDPTGGCACSAGSGFGAGLWLAMIALALIRRRC